MSVGKNSINRASKATEKPVSEAKQDQKFYVVPEDEAKAVQEIKPAPAKAPTQPKSKATGCSKPKAKKTEKEIIQVNEDLPIYLL